jgi:hypothetical protein
MRLENLLINTTHIFALGELNTIVSVMNITVKINSSFFTKYLLLIMNIIIIQDHIVLQFE